jgi:NAD(P)-dependent dehydrogenase (short-subunit alcohol dehydrogenase family)
MSRLGGKAALVTGGARGIGASAKYVHLDVTKPDDWKAAVAAAVRNFGKVDVLGNDASIANLGVFLASEESSFSAGSEFIADGGELAGMIRQNGEPATQAAGAGR